MSERTARLLKEREIIEQQLKQLDAFSKNDPSLLQDLLSFKQDYLKSGEGDERILEQIHNMESSLTGTKPSYLNPLSKVETELELLKLQHKRRMLELKYEKEALLSSYDLKQLKE